MSTDKSDGFTQKGLDCLEAVPWLSFFTATRLILHLQKAGVLDRKLNTVPKSRNRNGTASKIVLSADRRNCHKEILQAWTQILGSLNPKP